MTYRVAVIGTGPGPEVDISGRSHSFAYKHARAYRAREDCRLVAGVDLVREYAEAFAETFDIPKEGVFEDHGEMLRTVEPDIVSVVTPIPTHADLTVDCVAGGVEAVHCEKPMARTWAEARAMYHVCEMQDVQLTIAHQRRFSDPVREVKRLLDAGEIGDLVRVETSYGNAFDNGTHAVDMAGYFAGEPRGAWVMGQVDYTVDHVRYGVPHATHAFVSWQYRNGVHGILATGDFGIGLDEHLDESPSDFALYDCFIRAVGTDGVIEMTGGDPPVRVRRDGEDWEVRSVDPDTLEVVDRAIDDAIDALASGGESEIRSANALNTAEILFGAHESSRRRGRVELPLSGVYDHPLESLIESGEVVPEVEDDRPPHPAEADGPATEDS